MRVSGEPTLRQERGGQRVKAVWREREGAALGVDLKPKWEWLPLA